MKTTIKKIFASILFLLTLTTCSNYLEIEQEGILQEEELFKNFQGYADAMSGIYSTVAEPDLYGNTLSFGFIDLLAQLYNPNITGGNTTNARFIQMVNLKYQDQLVRPTIDGVWTRAYKAISYLNNIIKFIEAEDTSNRPEFNLIKGEAYGLRAFLHFDIMRMFTETITSNQGGRNIPYAENFGTEPPLSYNKEDFYNKIIKDLDKAEIALAQDSFTYTTSSSFQEAQKVSNNFERDRDIHFNKYAVWATKARVFLWKGNMEQAAIYADKVINSSEISLFNSFELSQEETYPFGKETIWGLYNNNLSSDLDMLFLRGPFNSVFCRDINDVYEFSSFTALNDDVRYMKFFQVEFFSFTRFTRLLKSPQTDQVNGVAMIRLPEMYYIAAEAYYGTNPQLAISYLEQVRASRGLTVPLNNERTNTKSKFIDEIFKEKYKELWGEGQIFLEYKRLNRDLVDINNNNIPANNDIFVFPIPDNELEFNN